MKPIKTSSEAGFAAFSPDSEIIKQQVTQEAQKQQATNAGVTTPDLGTVPFDLGTSLNNANTPEPITEGIDVTPGNVDVSDTPVEGIEAVGEAVGEFFNGVGEFFNGVGEVFGGL